MEHNPSHTQLPFLPLQLTEPLRAQSRGAVDQMRASAQRPTAGWRTPNTVPALPWPRSVEAEPETDRHLPWIRRLRSAAAVHCWAALPLQVHSVMAVPLADLLPTSFRRLPPTPERHVPVGPVPDAAVTVQLNDRDWVAPLSDALTCTGKVPARVSRPVRFPDVVRETPDGRPVAV